MLLSSVQYLIFTVILLLTIVPFLQQNQLDALISQIYFWNRTLHVSDIISVHHQESSAVHTAIGIGHIDCATAIVIIKPTRNTNFSSLFLE